jgi:hypothetical protein
VGENKVSSFDRLVTRKAGFVHRFVGRFAIFELGVSPAAGRGVFSRVLDHQLNINGGPGNERLSTAKVKATIPDTVDNATSKKAIRFIAFLLRNP